MLESCHRQNSTRLIRIQKVKIEPLCSARVYRYILTLSSKRISDVGWSSDQALVQVGMDTKRDKLTSLHTFQTCAYGPARFADARPLCRSRTNVRMIQKIAFLCVAGVATGAHALHYANFVRALVPRSWLALTALESNPDEDEQNQSRHQFQGHALRPWHEKADGLRLDFFSDTPFEFDWVVPQNLKKTLNAHWSKQGKGKGEKEEANLDGNGQNTGPRVSGAHVDTHRRQEVVWKVSDERGNLEAAASLRGNSKEHEKSSQLQSSNRDGPVCCQGSQEACSWTVSLQARSMTDQHTYMEQETISASRTEYEIDECVLLKSVVARRVGLDTQELTCTSITEGEVFVNASVSILLKYDADVEGLLALVHHTVLSPVGEVTVDCSCQDGAVSTGEL